MGHVARWCRSSGVTFLANLLASMTMPLYWRTTFWGREGVIEIATTKKEITVIGAQDKEMRQEELPAVEKGGYLRSFLDDIAGKKPANDLDTAAVLGSIKNAIKIQEAANCATREVSFA